MAARDSEGYHIDKSNLSDHVYNKLIESIINRMHDAQRVTIDDNEFNKLDRTIKRIEALNKPVVSQHDDSFEWDEDFNSLCHDGSPPEVTTTVPLGVEPSSNYLSLKSKATPGDRGRSGCSDGSRVKDKTSSGSGLSETIYGSRGEVNREGLHGEWETSGETECKERTSDAESDWISTSCIRSDDVDGSRDPIYDSFNRALCEMASMYGNISDGIYKPPLVPVTKLFRRFNAYASNVYDYYRHHKGSMGCNVVSDDQDDAIRKFWNDIINGCLTSPNSFNKDNTLNVVKIIDNIKDNDLIKLLFSWYMSGYFTGRTEALIQSIK